MINNTELTDVPEYAASSAYVEEPTPAQIDQGTLPGEKLPSEWWNFYTQLQTLTNNNTKAAFDNILSELKGALALGGLTADGSTTQLADLFGRFVFGTNDKAYTPLSNVDANTVVKAGFYSVSGTGQLNTPSASSGWKLLVLPFSTDGLYVTQLIFSTGSTSDGYIRKNNNGTWTAWAKLWNAANDGSGSGLDADLFDGMQSDRFIFGSGSHGSNSVGSGSANDLLKSGFYRLDSAVTNLPTPSAYHVIHFQSTIAGYASQIAMLQSGSDAMYYRKCVAGVWANWSNIWTSSTDGSGSGLDADTVDGVQGGRIIYGDDTAGTTAATDANNITKSGFYFLTAPYTNSPETGLAALIIHLHTQTSNRYVQIAVGTNGYNSYIRYYGTSGWSSWVKLWNASNDGSGSGLDADTVDGLHATRFAEAFSSVITSGSVYDYFVKSGMYVSIASATNAPTATTYCYYVNVVDSNTASVLAVMATTGDTYVNTKTAGAWSSWKRVNTNSFTQIPAVTADPASPVVGQMWLRSDL